MPILQSFTNELIFVNPTFQIIDSPPPFSVPQQFLETPRLPEHLLSLRLLSILFP